MIKAIKSRRIGWRQVGREEQVKNVSNYTPEGQMQIVRYRSGWKGDFIPNIVSIYELDSAIYKRIVRFCEPRGYEGFWYSKRR